MRSRSIVAGLSASALLAGVALAADAVKGPWDGYGVGTTLTMKTTMKISMEGAPETVTQSRTSLIKVTDDAYTLKMEMESGGSWTAVQDIELPRRATPAAVDAPKPEELGEEKVTVGSESLACKKTKVVAGGATSITWTNGRYGVLKSETTGPGEMKTVLLLTSLAKKVAIAGKELECREQTVTSKGGGFDSTTTMTYCDMVPGGWVRNESTSTVGGVTTTSVTEVTSYDVK